MAQDALTFSVKFMEDEKQSISNLIKELSKQLSSMVVHLDSKNIDVSGLKTEIGKLSGVKVVDQKNLTEAEKQIKNISDLLEKALQGKNIGEQFVYILHALREVRDQISSVSQAMGNLSNEIKSIGSGMSANIGNAIVNSMTQVNESITQTIAKIGELRKAAEDPGKVKTPQGVNDAVNMDIAMRRISEINGKLMGYWQTMRASTGLGFPTGDLEKYISGLQKVREILQTIVAAGGSGKRVDEILRDSHFGTLMKNADNEKKAVDLVSQSVERLKDAFKSLEGKDGAGALRKKISDEIRKLEKDYKNPNIGKDARGNVIEIPVGVKLQQAESVNRFSKGLVDEANKFNKDYAQRQKEETKEQERLNREQQKFSEAASSAHDKVREKIKETEDALVKLRAEYRELSKLIALNPNSGLSLSGIVSQMSVVARAKSRMENELRMGATDPSRLIGFAGSDKLDSWKNGMKDALGEVGRAINKLTSDSNLGHIFDTVKEKLESIKRLGEQAGGFGFKGLADDAKKAYDDLAKIEEELIKIRQTGASSNGLGLADFLKTKNVQAALSRAGLSEQTISSGINKALEKRAQRNNDEISRLRGVMKELESMRGKLPDIKIPGVEKAINEVQELINKLQQAKESGLSRQTVNLGAYSRENITGTMSTLSAETSTAIRQTQQMEEAQRRMGQAIAQATGEARQQSQVLSDLRSMAAQYLSVWGATSFIKEIAQVTGELELQERSLGYIIGSASKAQELYGNIKEMSQMSPYTFQDLLKSTRQLAAFGVETKDLYKTMKSLSDLGAGLDVDVQRLILAYGHVKSAGVLSGIQRRQFETAGINITGEVAKVYNERYRRAGSDERVTNADVFKMITKRQVAFEDVEAALRNLTSEGGRFYNMQLRQYDTLGGKLRNLRNNYNIMLDEMGRSHMGLLTTGVDALNSLMENWRKWWEIIKAVGAALVAAKIAQVSLSKSFLAHRAAMLSQRSTAREAALIANLGTPTGGYFGGQIMPKIGKQQLGIDYAQKVLDSNMSKTQKLRAVLYRNINNEARALLYTEMGISKAHIDQINKMSTLANSAKRTERIMGRIALATERMKLGFAGFVNNMRAGFASLLSNPMVWIGAITAGITAVVSRFKELDRQAAETKKKIEQTEAQDLESINSALDPIKERTGFRRGENGETDFTKSVGSDEAHSLIETLDAELQKFDPLYKGHLFNLEEMQSETDKVKAMILGVEEIRLAKETVKGQAAQIAAANKESGGFGKDTFAEELKEQEGEFVKGVMWIAEHSEEARKEYYKRLEDLLEKQQKGTITKPEEESLKRLQKFLGRFESYGGKKSWQEYLEENLMTIAKYEKYGNTELSAPIKGALSDMQSNEKALFKKLKEYKSVFAQGLRGKNSPGEQAAYIAEIVETIMNQEEFAITDEKFRDKWTDILYRHILYINGGVEGGLEEAYKELMSARWGERAAGFREELEREGKYDLDNLSDKDIEEITELWRAKFREKYLDVRSDIQNLEIEAYNEALKGVLRGTGPEEVLTDWQRKFKDALGAKKFKDIKIKFGIDVSPDMNIEEFLKKTQEKYGEAKKSAEMLAKSLNVRTKLGIKIDTDVAFGSFEGVKKIYDALKESRSKAGGGWGGLFGGGDPTKLKEWDDMYGELLSAVETMMKILEGGKAADIDAAGIKSVNANKEKKEKKEKDKTSEEEKKEVERIRNRIRDMQQLQREYKQLTKATMNEATAIDELVKSYQKVNGKNGPLSEAEIRNIKNLESWIENEANAVKGNKRIKNKNEKESLERDIRRTGAEYRREKIQENTDRLLGEMNTELAMLADRFDVLRRIVDKTGDTFSAATASGFDEVDVIAGNYPNIMERFIISKLQEHLGSYSVEAGKDIPIYDIDFKAIGKMSETQIEKYVKDMFGNADTHEYVPGIINYLKEYMKEVRNYNKQVVDAYTQTIGSAQDYNSVVTRLRSKLRETLSLINHMPEGTNKEWAKLIEETSEKFEEMKLEDSYTRFMEGDTGMSQEDVTTLFERLQDMYLALLAVGKWSPNEFVKNVEDLYKKRSEYELARLDKYLPSTPTDKMEKALKEAVMEYRKASDEFQRKNIEYLKKQSALSEQEQIVTDFFRLKDYVDELKKQRSEASARGDRDEEKRLSSIIAGKERELETMRVKADSAQITASQIRIEMKNMEPDLDAAKDEAEKKGNEVKKRRDALTQEEKEQKVIGKTVEALNQFKEAIDFVSGVLSALGTDTAFMEDASTLIGSVAGGANTMNGITQALGMAGPWGAAAGAALGLLSGVAQIHDNKLQRAIDEIKLNTEKMTNTLESIRSLRERTLGYDSDALRRQLAAYYTGQIGNFTDYGSEDLNRFFNSGSNAAIAMAGYYSRYSMGNGYSAELNLLKEQRDKIQEMYDLEDKKKKKSKEDLESYRQQIAELDEQIMFFAQDLANELWGIDLKGWADQLGDALMTAFENGTSAAAAFKDSVQDIMRGVVKNMLTVGIIEPALQKLQEKLFGKDGNGGIFDPDNPKGSMGAVLAELGNWFENEGPALMDAANEFYNGADDLLRQTLGYGLDEREKSSNTVNSITSTASEETMGIVAGYLSRLSQDVSVQRIMQEMFVNGSWPDYIEQVTTANGSLNAIDRSTTAMMEMMRDGTGALYERVESMSRRLDNFANGIDRITVN